MKRLNNHTIFTLAFVIVLVLIAVVFAQTPNPGHTISQIDGVPTCNSGEILTTEGGSWHCVSIPTESWKFFADETTVAPVLFDYLTCSALPSGWDTINLANGALSGLTYNELMNIKAVSIRTAYSEVNIWGAGDVNVPAYWTGAYSWNTIDNSLLLGAAGDDVGGVSEIVIPVTPQDVGGNVVINFHYVIQGTNCATIGASGYLTGYLSSD